MGHRTQFAALAACSWLAACGSGGSGSASFGGSGASQFGNVRLLDHSPADDAAQVPVDARIELTFDSAMALDSFGDEDTWLRVEGSAANVAGSWGRANGRVRFTPDAPLAPETDYVCQVSALSCDESGRILDVTTSFRFRTLDETPPHVAAIDVAAGTTGVSRTRSFTVAFDERVDRDSVTPASFFLRDGFGFRYDGARTFAGNAMTLAPYADLPGDRQFALVVSTAVTDRAGNPLGAVSSTAFRTAADGDSPAVTTAWPAMQQSNVSPNVQPLFVFDESMDPASVEAASLLFQDQYGSIVAFTIANTADQRTLRVVPRRALAANRTFTMQFLLGGAAATDVSGNTLVATQTRVFTTGSDTTPPALVASVPAAGETRVPGSVVASATFQEPLDAAWVNAATVELAVAGVACAALVELPAPATVRVTPLEPLPTNTACVLTLRGGQEGLHDLAGNVMLQDVAVAFTTSGDAGTPTALLLPADGTTGISRDAHVSIVFDAAMDELTLTSSSIRVTDDAGTTLEGELAVRPGRRVVVFTPAAPLAPVSYYRVVVASGPAGVRRESGNWLPVDLVARFHTGNGNDSVPPQVTATVNGVHATRRAGLVLPPSGFTIDVDATDADFQLPDLGNCEVLLEGSGPGPASATLLAGASIGYQTLQVRVPADAALAVGNWTLRVRVPDLAGNRGESTPVQFTVAEPTATTQPFERTQVVWVRTDLDRDGNGRADFDDDLLRLGFAAPNDPSGSNAYMRRLVLDGIVAASSRLYRRGSRGEPLDSGSVALRFTTREPIRVQHTQMALGGLDPEGNRLRTYGAESTGTLGRAYYDHRNGNPSERNTSVAPGLGVFPAEMWLYQTHVHQQVWPAYVTVFAQRFLPLCPAMGGTPAGAHALDAVVLSPSFVYATATAPQRARWQVIMDAADDWCAAVGIVLAHEIGHSVGLVAPGAAPSGLFGDASLHDTYAGATEVMAPSVGYEAMTALDYSFRDVDLAYLRQRVLVQ